MKHEQILKYLCIPKIVQAMDEDLRRLVTPIHTTPDSSAFMRRWRCALEPASNNTGETRHPSYIAQTKLAMALLSHKYNILDPNTLSAGLSAVDELISMVALPRAFENNQQAIRKLLQSNPKPLARNPSKTPLISFFRAQDVISIHLHQHYYAAYVYKVRNNEVPTLVLYNKRFDHKPSLADLNGIAAWGRYYPNYKGTNLGVSVKTSLFVAGLSYLPDPAGQVELIAAAHPTMPPDHNEPNRHCALPNDYDCHQHCDLFSLQRELLSIGAE